MLPLFRLYVSVLGLSLWLLAVYLNGVHHDSPIWPYAFAVAGVCFTLRVAVPHSQTVKETRVEKERATTVSLANPLFF